jgi:hypothetical protein
MTSARVRVPASAREALKPVNRETKGGRLSSPSPLTGAATCMRERTRPLPDRRLDVTSETNGHAPDRLVEPLVVRDPGSHSDQGDQT